MSVTSWFASFSWRVVFTSSTRGYAFQFSTTTGTVPLSPGGASSHAQRFREVADQGDEVACRNFGGEGSIPSPSSNGRSRSSGLEEKDGTLSDEPDREPQEPPEPAEEEQEPVQRNPDRPELSTQERIEDVFDTTANSQVNDALIEFFFGGLIKKITYGPNEPWTRALQKHFFLDAVRESIRDAYRQSPGGEPKADHKPFRLNDQSLAVNAVIFARDVLAPLIGLNMAYTTGSMDFMWNQVGAVDTNSRTVTVAFTATDSLRAGSLTRLPTKYTHIELERDNPHGEFGPRHTVKLEWHWTETIRY